MPAYGVVLPLGLAFADGIAAGILDAAAAFPGVVVRLHRDPPTDRRAVAAWLRWAAPDGAIAFAPLPGRIRQVRVCGDGTAAATVDEEAVGRLAAEHLLAAHPAGLCALDVGSTWSRDRAVAFVARCREAGRAAAVVDAAGFETSRGRVRIVARLRALPAPLACFAGNDRTAAAVADACAGAGIAIGERVLLVGADDDPLACRAVHPQLSSVRIPWTRVGAEALRLLHGGGGGTVRVPPLGLAVRGSSDPLTGRDSAIAAAMAAARAGAAGVAELVAAAGLSRRALERRCREALGSSPLHLLHLARLDRARGLLAGGAEVSAVAHACGWASRSAFAAAFRAATGETPAAWARRRM